MTNKVPVTSTSPLNKVPHVICFIRPNGDIDSVIAQKGYPIWPNSGKYSVVTRGIAQLKCDVMNPDYAGGMWCPLPEAEYLERT
jgi:hypothetical protein